jgi:hypothetical protein
MVFLMGGMPVIGYAIAGMIGYAIGSLLFSRFSLSEAEHASIRRALDARALARA